MFVSLVTVSVFMNDTWLHDERFFLLWLSTVRQKVKELVSLIQDDDALRAERKKAKKNKDKYIGMSGGLSGQYYS